MTMPIPPGFSNPMAWQYVPDFMSATTDPNTVAPLTNDPVSVTAPIPPGFSSPMTFASVPVRGTPDFSTTPLAANQPLTALFP